MAQRVSQLDALVEDKRVNAGLAWLLVGFLLIVAAGSLLQDDLLWALFAGAVAALALVPPVSYRNTEAMLPWEVLVLAALPVLGRELATLALTTRVATYLSVAALALIVAVELHVFTPVRMTHWFAVLFVVIATIATAGVWAVVQWLSDVYLGTQFLGSEYRLMWDFVYATVVGAFAGIVFELYFRRVIPAEERLPIDVQEQLR
ncbi:hypothetical protein ZOD2009_05327 [Haladaptatus paucihalophilus DX253]|uniref:Uncharacterized protein n=1 Tax=Haladaptatus paucihalophilus DX253 TaxID=797209 RepID=E7QQJ5_HALPU|nr:MULTISPECIES: hypothetical protein [Haladaptatus]EFW93259.1 hypothetical protein ZOD2009_05327 [Haladaptatus paucihalophilus DX253]ODR82411.1 hypothetical protein BG842_16715 [Haladaptatus sp. W1]GKZ12654.1 hypothetical protein HAL_05350 [Haladaptatus sp. T7]SHK49520.1 hypothetical protein SAMN05444342_1448 [Haladaptatus paucihalophilus DX253]